MKKIISLVLTLVMLASMCTMFASVSTVSAAGTTTGDVNNDGVIDSKDSLLLKKYVAGVVTSGLNTTASDVNGDGRVTSKDVQILRFYLSGVIDTFDGAATAAVGEFTICGNDISEYEIVLQGIDEKYRAWDNYKMAADDLRDYISSANGYTLSQTYSATAGKHHIFFPFVDNDVLGKEGYTWKTENEDLYIIGGYRRGCAHAIYDFLKEYLGWRWFRQDLIVCLGADLVNVPNGLDYTYVPALEYRDVHHGDFIDGYNGNDKYAAYYCVYEHINSNTGRGIFDTAKKTVLGEGNVGYNAHSFDWIFGISNQEQPCLSHPDCARSCANVWINEVTRRSQDGHNFLGFNLDRVSISWNDNENYCYCDRCKAIYIEEQSIAGTIVRNNNQAAIYIREALPMIDVYYVAYGSARIPPVKTRPNNYCVVTYCWNGCNNHTFDSDECSAEGNTMGYKNWEERYYFEAWSRITPHKLFCWYYSTSFAWNVGPCPNLMNILADFKYLASHGCVGIYAEAENDAIYSFEPLRNYLMAEVMWNPYMSDAEYEQLMDEFLEAYYGPGWHYIRQYIDIQTEAGDRCGCFTNNYDWPGNMYDYTYMYEQYDNFIALFDNAKAAAETTAQYQNVEKLSVHAYFAGITGAYLTGHGYEKKFESAYGTMYALMQKYKYVASIYGVPSSYNSQYSPLESMLDLPDDGKWETYYNKRGGVSKYPRSNPNCSGRKSDPYVAAQPTKTYNPYENLGR